MFFVRDGKVIKLIDTSVKEEKNFLTQVLKFNKHNFISSLMASKVLLCEGKSEYNSLPLFSEVNDNFLLDNNVNVLKAEGKTNFPQYLKMYKKLNIPTTMLLDNDKDNTSLINDCKDITDTIILQENDYEDIIYPGLEKICNNLEDIIPIIDIKDFLKNFPTSKEGKKNKYNDVNGMINSLDIDSITSYSDLYSNKEIFTLVLHQKFVSDYHCLFITNLFIENDINPEQYKNLFEYLIGKIVLKDYIENSNVKLLGEKC